MSCGELSLSEKTWKDECGVFAIWNHPDSARLTYLGLYAQQHRGQESCGIVTLHQKQHIIQKGLGLVGDVFNDKNLSLLVGNSAIGHVRYSTTGQNLIGNAQPLTSNLLNGPVALAHNGNIVNQSILREALQREGSIFQGTNDTEILLHLMARNPSNDLLTAFAESAEQLVGAYSFVVMSEDRILAARDPLGFRPLVLGQLVSDLGISYVVASESCAFDLIGAEYIREIEPGEILEISKSGLKTQKMNIDQSLYSQKQAPCVFEHVYFSRPDSNVFGISVYESRKKFGEQLAIESGVDADLVIPIPDSGIAAALGFSQKSGIPFEFGIIRNHYVGRTFIQPAQAIRDFGVRVKLNAQANVLKGKRVIVIDDSLVRGTTSQKIILLLKQAGATEVHMRIASPPTIGPCYYGVDTPEKSQLIASHQSIDEIKNFIGADSLSYLSLQGMFKALSRSPKTFCSACFSGEYPTSLKGVVKKEKPEITA
jgi:amidophosphoribosyltransferase